MPKHGLIGRFINWADANAFHYKNHGTHQEHLDDMHRRCHDRPLKEAAHEIITEPENNSWVQVMLVSGWIGIALIGLCLLIG